MLNSTYFINFRVQDIFNTQSTAKAVSKNGILFFGLVNNTAVGCLNEHQPIQKENTVSNCEYFLIFFLFFTLFYHTFSTHFFQNLLLNMTSSRMKRIHVVTLFQLLHLTEIQVTWHDAMLIFDKKSYDIAVIVRIIWCHVFIFMQKWMGVEIVFDNSTFYWNIFQIDILLTFFYIS